MTSNPELLVIQYLFMYLLTIHIEGMCPFFHKYENIHIHVSFFGNNVYPGPLSSPHPFFPCCTMKHVRSQCPDQGLNPHPQQ